MDKRIFFILMAIFITVIGYCGYVLIDRHGKTAVTFLTMPDAAQIEFSGQKISGSQTVYLKPGEYTFTGSRDGFEKTTIKTTIKSKPVKILITLTPQTEAANKELSESKNSGAIDLATTDYLSEKQRRITDKVPLVEKLPIRNLLFTIGYRADDSRQDGVIIEIDAAKGYRNAALKEIEKNGTDPSQLNINFRTYSNPFAE